MNSSAPEASRQSADTLRAAELPPNLTPAGARSPRAFWSQSPPELLADPRLTHLGKLVCLSLIARGRWLRQGEGDILAVVPCTERLATEMGRDPSSIRRVIRRLKTTLRGDGLAYLVELVRDDGRVMWYLALPYPANPLRRPDYVPAEQRKDAMEEKRSASGSGPAYARGEAAQQDRARKPRPSPWRGALEPGQRRPRKAAAPPADVRWPTDDLARPKPADAPKPPDGQPFSWCAARDCAGCGNLASCPAEKASQARQLQEQLQEQEQARQLQLQQEAQRLQQEARRQAVEAARALVPRGGRRQDTAALAQAAAVHCLPILTLTAPGQDAGPQQASNGLQVPEKSGSGMLAGELRNAAEQQDAGDDPPLLLAAEQHSDPLLSQLERCRAALLESQLQHGPTPILPAGPAGPLAVPPVKPRR